MGNPSKTSLPQTVRTRDRAPKGYARGIEKDGARAGENRVLQEGVTSVVNAREKNGESTFPKRRKSERKEELNAMKQNRLLEKILGQYEGGG